MKYGYCAVRLSYLHTTQVVLVIAWEPLDVKSLLIAREGGGLFHCIVCESQLQHHTSISGTNSENQVFESSDMFQTFRAPLKSAGQYYRLIFCECPKHMDLFGSFNYFKKMGANSENSTSISTYIVHWSPSHTKKKNFGQSFNGRQSILTL
jgi:hypothetical protein